MPAFSIMDNIKTSNLLVFEGGEVKSGDGGIVEGVAIAFGSEADPDSSAKRDFFTTDSHIRNKTSFEVPLYYEHGMGLIDEEIGEAVVTKDENGWKAIAQINIDSKLGAKVYEAVKAEPHGFSTGALSHLVKRESRPNETNFLKQWVVGELSLTKRPAERKAVVESIKSVDGELVLEDAFREKKNDLQFSIFGENEQVLWSSEAEEKNDTIIAKLVELKDSAKSIEFKDTSGSVSYSLYTYNEDGGAEIMVNKWGTAREALQGIQEIINQATADLKSTDEVPVEEDFETRVKKIIATTIPAPVNNEVEQLKDELENKTKELAEKTSELSTRDEALTIANERIAQLEILAGATETITKHKGK